MSATVRCVWEVGALLGEGPVWDHRRDTLWFVDIKRGHLHRHKPGGGSTTEIIGGTPSFVLPSRSGGLVIGNGRTLHHFMDGGRTELAELKLPDGVRLNDATIDADGRIWFGSMDDHEERQLGQVHVYDRGAVIDVGGAAVITNGPAITANGRWLYHVDTLAGQIWRFDIYQQRYLKDGQLFASIARQDGTPDGVTIDAEDHLWVALWGGWAVRRYAPNGELVNEVQLPCANVTKVAFGGPDLATAFVTTAALGLDAQSRSAQPQAGGLFAFDAEVPGKPLPAANLLEGS